MPWLETTKVDQRDKFIRLVLTGEMTVAAACRAHGISRPTGYKWLRRFEHLGLDGLLDQRRRPKKVPHKTPDELVAAIISVRKQYPTWGPKKVRAFLKMRRPKEAWPASSTVGDILTRAGLVKPRKRSRGRVPRTQPLSHATAPNALWTMDFKGQFRLGDGSYCYPLTVADAYSRMLLGCIALTSTRGDEAWDALERVFERYGLPSRIRTDNGAPFASRGLAGLSRMSAHWVSLGVELERIEPGHPEQNGRHERMHLTLKRETARPSAEDRPKQQARFDDFQNYYNHIRPHEGIDQQTPGSLYEPSELRQEDRQPDYADCDMVRTVYPNGTLHLLGRGNKVHVGQALAGLELGLIEDDDGLWLLRLGKTIVAMYDEEDSTLAAVPPEGLVEFPTKETT